MMFFGKTKYIVDKSMAQHRLASTSWQDSAVHLHHKVKGHLFENGRAQSLRAGCLKEVLKRLSVCSWSSLYPLASLLSLPVQFCSKLNRDCYCRELTVTSLPVFIQNILNCVPFFYSPVSNDAIKMLKVFYL